MIYYLPYIESVGFYAPQDWVKDFRNATWFETLEEAKAIPADTYLRADIQIYENAGHSHSPIIEHRFGKYRAYCRNCNQSFGRGKYNRTAAFRKYQEQATGKCETVILKSLQKEK